MNRWIDNLLVAGFFLMMGIAGYSVYVSIVQADAMAYSAALDQEAAVYMAAEGRDK